MREWTLGPGDPLALTLAADFRLCTPDYVNDQIWDLETAGGDPPALTLRTTYGLRARSMRIFPRFVVGGQAVTDPAFFPVPVRLRRFYPNFLLLDFSPFTGLEVVAEYWVPDSHTTAGRFTITNRTGQILPLFLEMCAQLASLDGQGFAPLSIHSVNILSGRTSNLVPVVFLTGGPQPGGGPYPSLALDLPLPPGTSRSLTWVHAALSNLSDSFDLARRTAAHPWEAEQARIELINTSQTVEIHTGDSDWDAAFALSQKVAFGLFIGSSPHLPCPSFVIARQPDHGYSPRGNGSDYPSLWNGQSPMEAYYIASLLPGAPHLAAGLIRNFLATQTEEGVLDWKPGLAGQRGRWLAAPLLASLAWHTYQHTLDVSFLREIHPDLDAFIKCWFTKGHDRDLDGFPEWDHPLQSGLEDSPAFTVWQTGGQGACISAVESPALTAMLAHEIQSLSAIAGRLGKPEECQRLELKSRDLSNITDECWDLSAALYHNRDRDSHRSPAGKSLGSQTGIGMLAIHQPFRQSVRLLVKISFQGEATRSPKIILRGQSDGLPQSEQLERTDFQWGANLAVATSRELYTSLDEVEIFGVEKRDRISLRIMDFSTEDITLFLPLWAGIPSQPRALSIIHQSLFAAHRFGRPFGIPTCVSPTLSAGKKGPDPAMDSTCQAVHIPWNALIGEGLIAYGLREDAAQLTARLMAAVIQNLKKQHAFFRAYNSETGTGFGERNPVQGLAPIGLFMDVLGVRIQSEKRVKLCGKNPFPWPVTVKYRCLTVTRQAEKTVVVFPDGQAITLDDPTEAVVSAA